MKKDSPQSLPSGKNQKLLIGQVFSLIVIVVISFSFGWLVRREVSANTPPSSNCIHLSGYQYINPLLLCDTVPKADSASLSALRAKLDMATSQAEASHEVDAVSVYFRDMTTHDQLNINGQEKYFPASLKKVPIMMSYFKEAQTNPGILTTTGVLQGTTDQNAGVEIPPKIAPQFGQSYSVNDLISMMIKYSDNNSFEMLSANLGDQGLKSIYQDLQIQYPDDQLSITDFITAYQFSLFLRTLYNGTYLGPDYSERALELMAEVDFKDGLVAGVPSDVTVAHKFGIETNNDSDGKLVQRELHDCGIVYDKNTPYVLCVMTKSSGGLTAAEKAIKDISAAAYQEVENNYK